MSGQARRHTLSACLIARNERHNVEACLESFADHVDEIVFVDTGSRDGTITELRRVAKAHGWSDKLVLGRFKWIDDFGAARTYAHSLASGDVHMWTDLDDRVIGADHLPALVDRFAANRRLAAILARYSAPRQLPAPATTPQDVTADWRPRLIRAPCSWFNPVWEEPTLAKGIIDSTLDVWWWHHRTSPRGVRDLILARRWSERDPDNWQAWKALAWEAHRSGDRELAASAGEQAVSIPELTPALRASLLADQSKRLADGQDPGAADCTRAAEFARRALALSPSCGDALLVLAKIAGGNGDFRQVRELVGRALQCRDVLTEKRACVQAGLLFVLAELNLDRYQSARDTARDTLALAGVECGDGLLSVATDALDSLQMLAEIYNASTVAISAGQPHATSGQRTRGDRAAQVVAGRQRRRSCSG